ncbi:MerR family transcriptional regulator [Actinomyces sp. 2119]|uniref:MerR family transcriptional regulator n=1 Tax=Actinomyces sp. 2119 TaxID=2321393 RepID=UPI000E6D2F0B|nr:MerR family transcriptional regulator [Actinomyces sp. 2119]RJF40224.1 MerR family transcriptional regulator [Actinomyces sp. 2119]
MRVKEIADLAGTTPRAVRHYHRLGLLPVPPTVHGKREYGVAHLARLMRIRWLAEGGLPLAQIAEVLAQDPGGTDRDSVLGSLRATREEILARRRGLQAQEARIEELIARVEDGEGLTPIPQLLVRFYDAVQARLDEAGLNARGLRAERQVVTALAALDLVPDSINAFLAELDSTDWEAGVRIYTEIARLEQLHGDVARTSAIQLAEETWEYTLRHRRAALAAFAGFPAGAPGRTTWRLTQMITDAYTGPAQHLYLNRFLELLMTDPEFAVVLKRLAGDEPAL